MKNINETLNEFDEKFNFLYCMENVEKDIKSFLSQSIKTALESVEKELIDCSTIGTNTIEIYREIKNKYLNEPEKNDICEFWRGSEKCTDKKADGSIFCRFHCDNLPF